MARPGVTYQDVVSATNELKGQGKSVTIENVRAILGTGSIGTINNHLRKWKEVQNATHKIASKENLPESLISLLKGLWEGVIKQSIEQFSPIEANYHQEITELKQELEKYRNNNRRWQKLFTQWQQEKLVLTNEKLTLEQALEFSYKDNHTLHAKQDMLIQQLQEKQERIEELHRLHKQTQDNLEHYRESVCEQRLLDQQQWEQQKQQWFNDIKLLKEENDTQTERLFDFKQKYHYLSNAYETLQKSYSQNQIEIDALKEKLVTVEKLKQEYLFSNQVYQDKNTELLKTIDNQADQIIHFQIDNKILLNELSESSQNMIIMQNQLKLITQEKWELVQEKSKMEGQLIQLQESLTT